MLMKHAATVRWQLWIVAFGFFMQTLDTTIVNTALPSMAASLGEPAAHAVGDCLLCADGSGDAAGQRLAGGQGRRTAGVFSAIVLFTLGSILCARSETLNELIASRVIQGIGGAMMVPVGRLTVMKIVPREQYMAAMTFVTLPGQIGPLMGPALGGFLVQYASWHWIFLINIPVGIVGAIATLLLMPNYQMQTRRFDLSGFILLAIGMASLTLALDGHKGMGLSGSAIAGLVALGVAALLRYVWHAYGNSRALFSLLLHPDLQDRAAGQPAGAHRQRHVAVHDAAVPAGGHGFHAVPRRADDDPDDHRQHGHETHRGAGGQPLWLPQRAGGRHAAAGAGQPELPVGGDARLAVAAAGGAVLPGMINSLRFSAMNTLTLKDLPDRLASSGNSLLSMVMQLSMSLGVSVAGILIGSFAHHQVVADSPAIHSAFIYSYCCMALIIALPALAFARVPADSAPNRTLTKEPGTGSTRLQ